jgi:hypothetical protein
LFDTEEIKEELEQETKNLLCYPFVIKRCDSFLYKKKEGVLMKILTGLSATFDSLTKVIISLLGLGIVVSLLGGNVPFVGDIASNITSLVQALGDAGIVGLVAAIIILGFYK